MSSPSIPEKLRILFRNGLRKGYIKNAEVDPVGDEVLLTQIEPREDLVVCINSKNDVRYWFTDRRVIEQKGAVLTEVLRYHAVLRAYWMFQDLFPNRLRALRSAEEAVALKRDNFDRLEVALSDRVVALTGLDQAYAPALRFFQWISPRPEPSDPASH